MNSAELTAASARPSSLPPRAHARHQPLLGGLLVKEGLINQFQLDRMLALQSEREPRPLLGQLLLDEKLITPHELNAALAKYERMHLLGDVLVETKRVTPAQLEAALAVQRRTGDPLGQILVQLGLIGERQLKQALAIQLQLPAIDLDEHSLDSSLASVVSARYARRHRALPITRDGDRIVVAMDDPTDVEVVAELRACTGQRIDVVVATTDALDRAFSRVYGDRGDESESRPPGHAENGRAAGEGMGQQPLTASPSEPTASVSRGDTVLHPAQPPRPGVALDAIRARMESIRQFARSWERGIDAVETMLRERGERRAELERLTDELRESRAHLARTSEQLEAATHTLERLEMAHVALLEKHETQGRVLAELETRHDALLRDRQFAMDQIGSVLRRLRPEV